ncbi:type VI secretion system baseplate subunit TssK [Pseudomonas cichorii]|nr:type VI secretion system baseplate subunit TssK [Pseudomonas cichorii]MBX8488840.1 type VI secretion system baseplate subunit TssK [Pseudomonas cichorii]MBX8566876.1 type VI secretion system baseplate subunit TssK [Pseudomonas cichorii]MBX8568861.1 type VI secretion system baseplate subunit TssK [Pseudomonas cichorii]MBX8618835.1 type VI secretion system baseplate subunit TssK [Pseudomonas cichorii]
MSEHKVIWREGMLLRPQHFQHNDRYYDHQMKVRTRLAGAYVWGFTELVIDPQFLTSGQIVIAQASGVLPDGSIFDLGDRDKPLALDIPPNTMDTPVYLALPLVTGNCIEARGAEQPDVLARYTSYTRKVSDSNAGEGNSTEIICARPDFRLLPGEQQGEQTYVRLKVCHVLSASPDKAITLAPGFTPTFINARRSTYLTSCLKEVVGLLEYRGDVIARRVRASGKVGGGQVGDFMMLQLINRTELLLRHYLNIEEVHPEELYRVLLVMLGDLATFGSDTRRPVLNSGYRHSDQEATFSALMAEIRQVLSMVLEQHATELELQARQYGVLVSPRVDQQLLGSASFVLAASAHCDTEELRHRLPSHLKVGSVESIRELVNLHLPGIRLRPLPVAPRQIPFHSNKTYFILELTAQEQALVENSGGFAFHVSGEFDGLDLQFWAIRNS